MVASGHFILFQTILSCLINTCFIHLYLSISQQVVCTHTYKNKVLQIGKSYSQVVLLGSISAVKALIIDLKAGGGLLIKALEANVTPLNIHSVTPFDDSNFRQTHAVYHTVQKLLLLQHHVDSLHLPNVITPLVVKRVV